MLSRFSSLFKTLLLYGAVSSEMNDRRLEIIHGHYAPLSGSQLWHGEASVIGSIRVVKPEEAAWKPGIFPANSCGRITQVRSSF